MPTQPETAARPMGLLAFALAALLAGGCHEAAEGTRMNSSQTSPGPAGSPARLEKATFGAGCFWGVEATFRQVPGVVDTAVGYSGGTLERPTYENVCSDESGHAEVVRVTFDPAKVTYEQLLEVFWDCHDPTTPDRQGPDVGTQYRSVIFCHTRDQQAAAKASKQKQQAAGRWDGRRIVTEILTAPTFWRAEEYHQRYVEKRGQDSCRQP